MRQLIERSGFHDRYDLKWKAVCGTRYLATCTPYSPGRTAVNGRMLRHFSILCTPTPTKHDIAAIFNAVAELALNTWPDACGGLRASLVKASLEIHARVVAHLLPTPSRFHYLFGLKDIKRGE